MLKKFINKFGVRGGVLLVLSPLLLPIISINHWLFSLGKSTKLLGGQWSKYFGFNPENALGFMFYRVQWININRYGRYGTSPIMGLGDFYMGKLWHLSLFASYLYCNAGALTTLSGMFIWIFLHGLYAVFVDVAWLYSVILVVFFSVSTYLLAFSRQNYQILSWMLMPALLFALNHAEYLIVAIILSVIGLLGVTAYLINSVVFAVYISIYSDSVAYLLYVIPGALISFYPLIYVIIGGESKGVVSEVAKLIGLTTSSAKYKRKTKRLSMSNLYFFGLYLTGTVLVSFGGEIVPVMSVAVLIMYVVNQVFVRFADEQSLQIAFVSTLISYVFLSEYEYVALAGLILVLNPLPFLFERHDYRSVRNLLYMNKYEPFDVEKITNKLENFIDLLKGSKVLFAFEDPKDDYYKVFDGYRLIYAPLLEVAAKKEVHLMPDWYSVAQTNYDGAPNFWGTSVDDVVKNSELWGADHVIVYSEESLNEQWCEDFDMIASFDWNLVAGTERYAGLWRNCNYVPVWWLLQKNKK